jgi:hypothetical protein
MPALMRRALVVAQVVAGAAIFACLYTMFGRLGYRCDLEWMSGAIYDHIERWRDGRPVYTEPSVDWTPFLYPPLYYALVAKLWSVLPIGIAARSVSIAASCVQGACIWRLARRHGATRTWAFIGLGIFAAAFADTSFWYDLERVDPLFAAMMLVGAVVLTERCDVVSTIGVGAWMGLGFFAKQPAVVFIAAAFFALLVTRQWMRAAAFAIPAGIVIVLGVSWLDARTGGWFRYYVLRMPGAHGVVPSLFKLLFFEDVPRAFALVASSAFFVGRFLARRMQDREDTVFACMLGAAGLASGSSRVHFGGWDNVLLFFITFACVATAIVGTRLQEQESRATLLLPIAAALQMIIWAYDPTNAVPPRIIVKEARAFEAKVKELEMEGLVVVTGRGHVTAQRNAHQAALIDIFRAEHKVPESIARPFRERRYASVIVDNFDDLQLTFLPGMNGQLFNVVLANYYVAERLPFWMPDAPVGFHTHPRLVLKARRVPLDEKSPEVIRCRAKTERAIAETRERAERGLAKLGPAPDIEEIARDTCDRGLEGTSFPKDYWLDDDPVVQ